MVISRNLLATMSLMREVFCNDENLIFNSQGRNLCFLITFQSRCAYIVHHQRVRTVTQSGLKPEVSFYEGGRSFYMTLSLEFCKYFRSTDRSFNDPFSQGNLKIKGYYEIEKFWHL
ncbi:rCG49662 [Rattus norvegicus]|uniref:RCG49662 n=1 Tax=Rattus norvegicus TaxID=10116 RepID=A6K2H1_RAT|nr:rCG49662 [Rattus norvegicus]